MGDLGAANLIFNKKIKRVFQGILEVFQNQYPELVEKIFLIHVPFYFGIVWKIVKTMIDEKTAKKMFYTTGQGTELMRDYFDIDTLPKNMGGKAENII